jgi:hypothetical protein
MTSSTSQSTLPLGSRTTWSPPTIALGNFVNVIGIASSGYPASAACSV